jgi:hypothetical protein
MSSDMSTEAVGAAGVTTTRVFLVDNHEMVVRGLAAAVGAEPDLEVAGPWGASPNASGWPAGSWRTWS